ncbi:hypothetical protein JHK85_041582 [Glycine max]|nr:hypothetical protein JHK87_040797 [Glycine soja]KAG4966607.1 hypothetical protein JHK85_041582 [Glycine max]KHN39429.1 hypothetical protein glysoja_016816 [Glycine soja]
MTLSKLIVASLLASLLLLHLVDADQSIVMEHVLRGVVYHLGHVSAKEPVELVVDAATACHLALLETKKCVPAMLV